MRRDGDEDELDQAAMEAEVGRIKLDLVKFIRTNTSWTAKVRSAPLGAPLGAACGGGLAVLLTFLKFINPISAVGILLAAAVAGFITGARGKPRSRRSIKATRAHLELLRARRDELTRARDKCFDAIVGIDDAPAEELTMTDSAGSPRPASGPQPASGPAPASRLGSGPAPAPRPGSGPAPAPRPVSGPAAAHRPGSGPISGSATELPLSRVLHLSDLHFENKTQATVWAGQLVQDLHSELDCYHLDAVVISGDITDRATSDQFAAASHFLSLLEEDLQLAPNQLIIVPGNHDLSWTISRKAYHVMRRSDHSDELISGAYVDKGEYIEVPNADELRLRFEAFAEFYQLTCKQPYALDYEFQATVHHYPAQRLLLLGLNSSWSLDHEFTARAAIYNVALEHALRRIRHESAYGAAVKIAVFHHPVNSRDDDRIHDTGFLERLAQAGFRFALHGHIHRAIPGQFPYDSPRGGRRIDILGAGTFGAPAKQWVKGVPLQYQLLEFSGNRLRVHTRCREEPDGAWKPDARWTQGPGMNPLPYYDIEL